jgi:ABC-type uncharacterized transport system permease subunit
MKTITFLIWFKVNEKVHLIIKELPLHDEDTIQWAVDNYADCNDSGYCEAYLDGIKVASAGVRPE